VQYVTAAGLALVVFVMLANFVVDVYARGVVRAAVDEAARTGAPIDASTTDCEARGRAVLDALLGAARDGVRIRCAEQGEALEARAEVTLSSWLPLVVPGWSFTLLGSVTKEREP
jgi:hypothetical protein